MLMLVSSPDPMHPLTRRNGLVNQVEFLGLWQYHSLKKGIYVDTQAERNVIVVREVLCNGLAVSLVLTTFGEQTQDLDSVSRWGGGDLATRLGC